MINVSTNITQVLGNIISKTYVMASDEGKDKLLRSLAISTAGDMARRIHNDGKKADGSDIGTYSKGYMVVRTGAYKNKTGKSGAGYYSRGGKQVFNIKTRKVNKKLSARPVYNRTSDTKVIFSLTREMENDFSLNKGKDDPIKTSTGYGVGFKNPENTKKAEWLTEKGVGRNKKIFTGVYELSEKEKESIRNISEDFIANLFKTR